MYSLWHHQTCWNLRVCKSFTPSSYTYMSCNIISYQFVQRLWFVPCICQTPPKLLSPHPLESSHTEPEKHSMQRSHNRNYPAMTTSTDYRDLIFFPIEVGYNFIVDAYIYHSAHWYLLASMLSSSQSLALLSTYPYLALPSKGHATPAHPTSIFKQCCPLQ